MTARTAPLQLIRHHRAGDDATTAEEYAASWRHTLAEDHPPIPRLALPRLRRHLCDMTRKDDDGGIRWHHHSNDPWLAVLDLHRAEQHTAASELAVLLVWCHAHGGPGVMWQITPAGTPAPQPAGATA